MESIRSVDFVANHDLDRLAAWLADRAEALRWRLVAIDATDDPAYMPNRIKAALRTDPDGLLLQPKGHIEPELVSLIRTCVETGHAVLICGLDEPDRRRWAEALVGPYFVMESGGAFLARLDPTPLVVTLDYQDLAQAPRPADLEAGFDRYETHTLDRPLGEPPPAAVGAALRLVVGVGTLYDFDPPGTVEVTPLDAAGEPLQAILRAVLPPDARPIVEGTRATVYRSDRFEDAEEAPGLCDYRLLLDLPSWLAAMVPRDRGYATLTRVGRRPKVRLVAP